MAAIILISLAGVAAVLTTGSRSWTLVTGLLLIGIGLLTIGNRLLFATCVAALLLSSGGWQKLQLSASPGMMTRSYFGIYSVRPKGDKARVLVHGTTIHGIQNMGDRERQRLPTSYYAPKSGVGLALTAAPRLVGPGARVGIVGLGAGTLACYGQPGQSWTFYEIDPVVVNIARDPSRFTFLSNCQPEAPVVVGDARVKLEQSAPGSADVLVIDAFSSDSVPMHLLTTEAFRIYRRHLSPNGLLLVHISNRYMDLEPVIGAAAAQGGWQAMLRHYRPSHGDMERKSYTPSIWVALSPSGAILQQLRGGTDGEWRALRTGTNFKPWSDDHASFLPLIRWGR
jgi:hypothetical protein